MFEKEVEGFGEIFRYVSYTKIGTAAMMSRATAGIIDGRLVVCLPGSPDAVRTGLELIIPEVPHVLHLAGRRRR
jgi:molybdenum cofactor biosynthesis protein B